GACPGWAAHHARQDGSRRRQARGRRGRSFRSRAHGRPGGAISGLRAAERQGLPPRVLDFTEAVAESHARVVDRLQFGAGEAPANPYASGVPTTAKNPNAAKLFLNWCLSEEGQTFMIKELGNLTSLRRPPVYPEGFDPKVVKVWLPNFDQYVKLHASWVEEWN